MLNFIIFVTVLGFGSPPFAWHKIQIQEYFAEKHKLLGKTWQVSLITIFPFCVRSFLFLGLSLIGHTDLILFYVCLTLPNVPKEIVLFS